MLDFWSFSKKRNNFPVLLKLLIEITQEKLQKEEDSLRLFVLSFLKHTSRNVEPRTSNKVFRKSLNSQNIFMQAKYQSVRAGKTKFHHDR